MGDSWEGRLTVLLEELVRTPSINPALWDGFGEAAAGSIVERELGGIKAAFVDKYSYADPAAHGGVRPNYVAHIPGRDGTKRLIIATHLDTVSPSDERDWKVTRPFEPRIMDGRLYGLGAVDNKGPVAAALIAASLAEPAQDVLLVFASDEESTNKYGIYRLFEEGIFDSATDSAYVPDCGRGGAIVQNSEKSHLWLKLMFNEDIPHHEALGKIARLRRSLMRKYRGTDEFAEGGRSTFEPTAIAGTQWTDTNTIAGSLRTEWTIPGAGTDSAWAAGTVKDFLGKDVFRGVKVEVTPCSQGGFTVDYKGRSAHAAGPENAASALLAAAAVEPLIYEALGGMGSGRIVGADAPLNVEMDCRLLQRHSPRDVLSYAEGKAAPEMAVGHYKKEYWDKAPASPPDHPLLKNLSALTGEICGAPPRLYQMAGWSMATAFRRVGIPSYGGGIVDDSCAHCPDESVDLDQLAGEVRLMKALMETPLG